MFDLDHAISQWRRQMVRDGIRLPDHLDELENHLREDIAFQTQSGAGFDTAFASSVERLGPAATLKTEFRKVPMKTFNRLVVYVAWAIYGSSFLAPTYMQGWGFQCAILQSTFWPGAVRGEWPAINYELLTLANLLMIVSPVIVFRAGTNLGSSRWFRGLTLAALLLVWSFIVLLMVNADRHELKIGAYMWGASFILLHLCSYKLPARKPVYA